MDHINESNCFCGSQDCWDKDDYSWLASNSGWYGDINGCSSSVFFIHGKKIREQRHLPTGNWPISKIIELVAKWSEGLPNGRLVICEDTGDGDPGLWIEGERDPNDADLVRLQECRDRKKKEDLQELKRLTEKYGSLSQ